MNSTTELTHNLQVKFHKELKKVMSGLTKPEQNNLTSIILGILLSGSCIMRRIAQNLKEPISTEKITDRFRVHLSKEHICDELSNNHLLKESIKLQKDDLVIVDPSDIIKKYAKKMENLSRVRDGSTGNWDNGYEVLEIIRLSQKEGKFRISPLVSELHSNNEAPGSMKQALFNRINDIIVYSNNQGIYVMDRWYDDKVTLNYLHENEVSYIIRSMGTRNLYYEGKEMNFIKVAKKANLKYKMNTGKFALEADLVRVGIPVDAHHRKNATLVYSNLIVARYVKSRKGGQKKGGFFYLFCNFPKHNMTEYEIIEKALSNYRLRWKIEEVHRQVKNCYAWEDMQVMTFSRLKNLNCLLLLAVSYLYSLDEYLLELGVQFSYLIFDKKKFSSLPKFIYYRLAAAVKELYEY